MGRSAYDITGVPRGLPRASQSYKHRKFSKCLRVPPRKVEPALDDGILRQVQETLRLFDTAMTDHAAHPPEGGCEVELERIAFEPVDIQDTFLDNIVQRLKHSHPSIAEPESTLRLLGWGCNKFELQFVRDDVHDFEIPSKLSPTNLGVGKPCLPDSYQFIQVCGESRINPRNGNRPSGILESSECNNDKDWIATRKPGGRFRYKIPKSCTIVGRRSEKYDNRISCDHYLTVDLEVKPSNIREQEKLGKPSAKIQVDQATREASPPRTSSQSENPPTSSQELIISRIRREAESSNLRHHWRETWSRSNSSWRHKSPGLESKLLGPSSKLCKWQLEGAAIALNSVVNTSPLIAEITRALLDGSYPHISAFLSLKIRQPVIEPTSLMANRDLRIYQLLEYFSRASCRVLESSSHFSASKNIWGRNPFRYMDRDGGELVWNMLLDKFEEILRNSKIREGLSEDRNELPIMDIGGEPRIYELTDSESEIWRFGSTPSADSDIYHSGATSGKSAISKSEGSEVDERTTDIIGGIGPEFLDSLAVASTVSVDDPHGEGHLTSLECDKMSSDDVDLNSESAGTDSDESRSDDGMYRGFCNQSWNHADFIGSILEPMKLALVDRVMEKFWVIFNQKWATNSKQCISGPSNQSTSGSYPIEDSTPSQPAHRKRKRDEGDDAPDGGGDRGSRQPEPSETAPTSNKYSTRLACPFRKHDPHRYNICSYQTCATSHWESIARVKEHLYRRHQVMAHCQRCWQVFSSKRLLDCHMTVAAADICEVKPRSPPDGITPEIERQLRSRKKAHRNQSEEDRWKDIYKLLFPNEDPPSPYFEPIQDEPFLSPESQDILNYQSYVRSEVPRLFHRVLEERLRREMQPVEATLLENLNLASIIQDCHDQAFRAYQERGASQEPTYQPRSDSLGVSNPNSDEDRTTLDSRAETEHQQPFDFSDVLRSPHPQNGSLNTPSLRESEELDNHSLTDMGYCPSCPNCSCVRPCSWGTASDNSQTWNLGLVDPPLDQNLNVDTVAQETEWQDWTSDPSSSPLYQAYGDFYLA